MASATRPTYALVDLAALRRNVAQFRQRAGGAQLMCVVKADAYGHGAQAVARAVLAAGANSLAVATMDEGVELRSAGITVPLLVVGPADPDEADAAAAHGLSVTLSDLRLAAALDAAGANRKQVVRFHLKVDTGLHRLGVDSTAVAALTRQLLEFPWLRMEGIYTHFSDADAGDEERTMQQLTRLLEAVGAAQEAGAPRATLRHAAGSYAAIRWGRTHLDLIRPGIALFGYHPAPELRALMPLEPVLSLRTRISQIRNLPAGEPVGYSGRWVTSRPTTLATLPAGFCDGVPRALANRGHVLVRGRRAPLVGSVALDACTVDVTDVPGACCDDEVVIIGEQDGASIWADEVAATAGTIVDEVLTRLGHRVPRRYTGV